MKEEEEQTQMKGRDQTGGRGRFQDEQHRRESVEEDVIPSPKQTEGKKRQPRRRRERIKLGGSGFPPTLSLSGSSKCVRLRINGPESN